MRHTYTQTKPCWRIHTIKQIFNVTVLKTVALFMITTHAFGLNVEGQASFGQTNNTVTVTVKGKLDLKTELPNSTKKICMFDKSANPEVTVTITAANGNSCQYNSSELKENWHFVLFTITSISGSGSGPSNEPTDTTTTTILLPTVSIKENEFYEMALYDKRQVQIKWVPVGSGEEFIAQGYKNEKQAIEVKVSKISIDGLFSKQKIL